MRTYTDPKILEGNNYIINHLTEYSTQFNRKNRKNNRFLHLYLPSFINLLMN